MSRIKQKKQGVINSLVWTQQDNSTATLSYDGTDFDFDAPVTVSGAVRGYESLTEAATVTLTAADSGKTFWINGSTSAADFTLPAPVIGLTYRWVWTANCNNAITITTADTTDTTGDMFLGGLLISAAAAVNTFVETAADKNKMTFDDNVENCAGGAGSWVEVICIADAVWFVRGIMNGTTDADGVGSAIFSDVD